MINRSLLYLKISIKISSQIDVYSNINPGGYLSHRFTFFFFKDPYHKIAKTTNVTYQCNYHHNNCIHRHKEHLLSQFYLQFSSFVIRPFAVLQLKNLPSARPTTITTPNCNSTVPVLSWMINGFSHVSGNHSLV